MNLKKHSTRGQKGCKCKMDPAIASTARGTLLKSTHKLINNAKAQRVYGDTYYLVVKCTKKWLQEEGFNLLQLLYL